MRQRAHLKYACPHCLLHEEGVEFLSFHLRVNHKCLQVTAHVPLELLPQGHLEHPAECLRGTRAHDTRLLSMSVVGYVRAY